MTESLRTREREDTSDPPERYSSPSLWKMLTANRRVFGAVVAVVVALVAIIVVSDLTSGVSRISDSTPCSVWSSAKQNRRDAYAARYVKEHGPLPSGASDAGTIEGVIDSGCIQAYGFDEADTVTVLQSIRHQY